MPTPTNTHYVVKIYTFKTLASTTPEHFLAHSQNIDDFALSLEGFVYRSVAQQKDGQWLDIVYWNSESAAQKANSIMEQPFMADFMACLDPESVCVQEAIIASQVYPQMNQTPPA